MGTTSSIDTVIPISLIHIKMKEGTRLVQKFEPHLNGMIYVFSGKITIANELRMKTNPQTFGLGTNQQIRDGELALLSEGDEIVIDADASSEFLILAGPELNEPIARHGPFVMNTREEIRQAFLDYQNGTFVD